MSEVTTEAVYAALREVYDPEIPVNVVDLGLVYDVIIDNGAIRVKMTLTSPACPVAPQVAEDARMKIIAATNVDDVEVEFVWEPMWNPGMMSWEARDQLGML